MESSDQARSYTLSSRSTVILKLDNLSKSFGGIRAVNGCSLHIRSRRITGLIGPNGAGKTTIFNMLAGALPPSAGHILFEGRDITSLATHQRFHRGIVRTFQIPQEFGKLTVLENLLVVPANQPEENLLRSLFSPSIVARREQQVRAHGEMMTLGAYFALSLIHLSGWHPLAVLPFAMLLCIAVTLAY